MAYNMFILEANNYKEKQQQQYVNIYVYLISFFKLLSCNVMIKKTR